MDENPYQSPEHFNPPQESRQRNEWHGGTDWFALSGLTVGSIAAVAVGVTAGFGGLGFGSPGATDELVSISIVGVFSLAGWCLGKLRQYRLRSP